MLTTTRLVLLGVIAAASMVAPPAASADTSGGCPAHDYYCHFLCQSENEMLDKCAENHSGCYLSAAPWCDAWDCVVMVATHCVYQ